MMRRGVGRVGRPSLIGTAARTAVVVGTASAVSNKSAANQQAKATQAAQAAAFEEQQQAAQIAAAVAAAVPAAPAAPAAGGMSDDDIAKLTQIANLHAQGILTDEEFAAQKAKILGL